MAHRSEAKCDLEGLRAEPNQEPKLAYYPAYDGYYAPAYDGYYAPWARCPFSSSSRTTETIYRHELRPVITTGADVMDKIFITADREG